LDLLKKKSTDNPETSVIAGFFSQKDSDEEIAAIKGELESLLKTAGGLSIKFFFQKKNKINNKYLFGIGKIEEIKSYIDDNNIDLILIYNSLSNVQQRNLESYLEIKVIDRTRLILDVFALRARTVKGKLQVELAQLLYFLPKLKGKGIELSRLGGGIGTRGPGETKLETDRRKINKRISIIKKKLKKLDVNRKNLKSLKGNSLIPVISLAGYTSAGKSTIFNCLTTENTYVTAKMFSTLDPLIRKMSFSGKRAGYYCFLTDTVGFIRKMPSEVIEAFRSTLEEISDADLILNIIDISDKRIIDKKKEVEEVFRKLNISSEKVLNIYNKVDLSDLSGNDLIPSEYKNSSNIYISALKCDGIGVLKDRIFRKVFSDFKRFRIVVDKSDTGIFNLNRWAIVTKKNITGNKINMEILTTEKKMLKFVTGHSEVFYEVLK